MRLKIPDHLVAKLKQVRAKQLSVPFYQNKLFLNEEVVVLDPGMGPATFLALDGRVFIWDINGIWLSEKEPFETEDIVQICAGIVIGASKLHMPELLELLPERPADARICETCRGTGKIAIDIERSSDSWCVCGCGGLGWVSKTLN